MAHQRPSREHDALPLLSQAQTSACGNRARALILLTLLLTATAALATAAGDGDSLRTSAPSHWQELAADVDPDLEGTRLDLAATGTVASEEAASSVAGDSYFAILTKMGLGLGLVLALVMVTVWLLRKSSLGQKMSGGGDSIRVLERTFLGPKKAIYLVRIGDRTLALGVTDQQVGTLSEWQQGELDLPSTTVASAGSFANQLRTMLGRDGAPNAAEVAQ